ncbi:threonine-phosphate decarboxylase CobD [Notoacmeibacter marinus]|nr:threonine-phosphate decarboxylase CobD [Notoacmeibacter marinus]
MRAERIIVEEEAHRSIEDGPVMPPISHGGDLDDARRLFPDAPTPWIDLSTGISPFAYPVPAIAAESWTRLPEAGDLAALCRAAASAYGAEAGEIVAGSGTQPLMAAVLRLLPPSRAAILGPTYAEHERLCCQAGHRVQHVTMPDQLGEDACIAIVVNPNNPTGTLVARTDLLALGRQMARRDGLLIVDEAFMDSLGDAGQSLGGHVDNGAIVVLRSVGKFYGLAGLRLSFALAARPVAEKLAAAVGPWPVSGPAIAVGRQALADIDWQSEQRARLHEAGRRMDDLLAERGLEPKGVGPLFRTLRGQSVPALFESLGCAGIWTRRFAFDPPLLRLGLPSGEMGWRRLREALSGFSFKS